MIRTILAALAFFYITVVVLEVIVFDMPSIVRNVLAALAFIAFLYVATFNAPLIGASEELNLFAAVFALLILLGRDIMPRVNEKK